MNRSVHLLAILLFLGSQAAAWSQDKAPAAGKKPPDGVYAVQRDSLNERDLLPLQEGETLVVHHDRYVKQDKNQPPRFLVVRSASEVALDLAGEPKAIKKGTEVVGIWLQLQPKAAAALERLTRDRLGKPIAIVVGGEVVTMHKVRAIIPDGKVQITSCDAGAAGYLLKQLQSHQKQK